MNVRYYRQDELRTILVGHNKGTDVRERISPDDKKLVNGVPFVLRRTETMTSLLTQHYLRTIVQLLVILQQKKNK